MVGVIHLFHRSRHCLKLSHARNTRVADATKGATESQSRVRFYGNAGSREPLDFTVFGPAGNEASRVAATCRPVDRLFYCQQRIPTVEGAFTEAGPYVGCALCAVGAGS